MTDINKKSSISIITGLIFSIASAVYVMMTGLLFFTDPRLEPLMYDLGVTSMGSIICAALFFGCMKQTGDGGKVFRLLIVLVSACFADIQSVFLTLSLPEQRTLCFLFCLLNKLIDLAMIYLFYRYIKITLNLKGKLLETAQIIIHILLVLETGILLSNIFYPFTFFIDENGMYQATQFSFAEDIYLAATSFLTMLMIIMSNSPKRQKAAAMTFILFPLIEYILLGAQFGNSGQYGMILMSVIIMYCVIFNDKSSALQSTQMDLQIASKIQTGALPAASPDFIEHINVDLHGNMRTAKEVGGDFYDYFPIDENRICFLIADVSGKGTPAALFMMVSKTMIKDYALTSESTSDIFDAVNARLCENNDEGMFATAWIGILDTRTMLLQYTNAGHNYPVFQRGASCEELEDVHGLFLAGLDFTCYEQSELQLEPGDRLLLFTDGVTEAHNTKNELYGMERLKNILEKNSGLPGEQMLDAIYDDIDAFSEGTPQFDDITMLVLTAE